jgi:hypothetical protein
MPSRFRDGPERRFSRRGLRPPHGPGALLETHHQRAFRQQARDGVGRRADLTQLLQRPVVAEAMRLGERVGVRDRLAPCPVTDLCAADVGGDLFGKARGVEHPERGAPGMTEDRHSRQQVTGNAQLFLSAPGGAQLSRDPSSRRHRPDCHVHARRSHGASNELLVSPLRARQLHARRTCEPGERPWPWGRLPSH